MNKHTKLVVGILVVLLILLLAALVSFSVEISKNSNASKEEVSELTVNPDGVEIIQGENQLYGAVDAGGNTIIEPEWEQLHFIGTHYVTALTKTENGDRIGILDLEGCVVTPFVYSEIFALNDVSYLAILADSDQAVLYDSTFSAVDAAVWDGYAWEDQILMLTKGEDSFSFSLQEDTIQLAQINLSRTNETIRFSVSRSGSDLSLLTTGEWSYTADLMAEFLRMLKIQDFSNLKSMTDQDHENAVLTSASLTDASITRISPSLNVRGEKEENGIVRLTWRTNFNVRTKENGVQERTMAVIMEKNSQEIWMVTDLKIV